MKPVQTVITVKDGETVVASEPVRSGDLTRSEQPRLFEPAPAQTPGQMGLGT